MATITAAYDYVQGHLRYGHIEMELSGEKLEEFKSLSDEEQANWLEDAGEFVLDDYEIDDKSELGVIEIEE
tara:strand:+ start:202 stop:414 length:213 start_codon:yes stop_codon:yes gene_type:complete